MIEKNTIFKLAVPLSLAQMAQLSMPLADTLLMGLLGVETLAGGGLGAMIFGFSLIVGLGFLSANGNLVAQASGARDHQSIPHIINASLLLALCLFAIGYVCLPNLSTTMQWLGQEPGVIVMADAYLDILVWAFLPALLFNALKNVAVALGLTKEVLVISIVAAVFNPILSYTLMRGLMGIPSLGLSGIAWATVATFSLMMIMTYMVLVTNQLSCVHIKLRLLFKVPSNTFKKVLSLGASISIANTMEAGLFTAAAFLAGLLGKTSLAAHQIALQCSSMSFMMLVGISQAVSIKVGHSYGSKDLIAVRQHLKTGLKLGVVCSLSAGAIMVAFADLIVTLFTLSDLSADVIEVRTLGASVLIVVALFQLVDGMQVITMGGLRGLIIGVRPTIITILGYWFTGFPAAYYLMSVYGLSGVWSGLGIGLGATAVMLLVLFYFVLRQLHGSADKKAAANYV